VNPIRTATGLIHLPAHVAAAAAGTAAGIITTGARTTVRVLGWAAGRVTGPQPQQSSWAASTDVPPARTAPARKASARRKAPSKKAAVMAPALGLTESEVLRRAADADKG
jgi:hypothetical protein